MFIRYSGKKVLVTYVYFGIGYCAFAQVIFTVILISKMWLDKLSDLVKYKFNNVIAMLCSPV